MQKNLLASGQTFGKINLSDIAVSLWFYFKAVSHYIGLVY